MKHTKIWIRVLEVLVKRIGFVWSQSALFFQVHQQLDEVIPRASSFDSIVNYIFDDAPEIVT